MNATMKPLARRLVWLLRIGVTASSLLLAAGLAVSMSNPNLKQLGSQLCTAGVLVLLATPFARVILSALSFRAANDRAMARISTGVFVLLCACYGLSLFLK